MTGILFLLALLIGPLPLGLTVLLGVESARRRAPIAHSILALLVIWTALQVSVALGLGALGELRPITVLAAEAVLFFTGIVTIRSRRRHLWAARCSELLPSAGRLTVTEGILVTTLLVVSLYMLFAVAAAPITDYDSLAYHLPIIARWSQDHHFSTFDFLLQSRYPFDWEALSAPNRTQRNCKTRQSGRWRGRCPRQVGNLEVGRVASDGLRNHAHPLEPRGFLSGHPTARLSRRPDRLLGGLRRGDATNDTTRWDPIIGYDASE